MCKRKSWMSKVCQHLLAHNYRLMRLQVQVKSHTHSHSLLHELYTQFQFILTTFHSPDNSHLPSGTFLGFHLNLLNLKEINLEVIFEALDLDNSSSLSSFLHNTHDSLCRALVSVVMLLDSLFVESNNSDVILVIKKK